MAPRSASFSGEEGDEAAPVSGSPVEGPISAPERAVEINEGSGASMKGERGRLLQGWRGRDGSEVLKEKKLKAILTSGCALGASARNLSCLPGCNEWRFSAAERSADKRRRYRLGGDGMLGAADGWNPAKGVCLTVMIDTFLLRPCG